jgi:ABC-type molybdate transport system substrate-binding protein
VVADLPEYKMDNYIAVLKSSPEKELAEEYVDYLLKSLSEGGRAR